MKIKLIIGIVLLCFTLSSCCGIGNLQYEYYLPEHNTICSSVTESYGNMHFENCEDGNNYLNPEIYIQRIREECRNKKRDLNKQK